MWEQFFNLQSDMDWAWGPLLPLRPSRDTAIRPWLWVRLFVVFTLLGLMLLSLVIFLYVTLPRFAAASHRPLPPFVSETLSVLQAIGADPGARIMLLALALSLPLLFFGFCLPYHWAWNRRAERLREQEKAVPEAARLAEDVWPPAPREAPTPASGRGGAEGESARP